MLNQVKFIERCKEYFPEYIYDKTIYTKSTNKVVVTCPVHGDFSIEARQLYRGHGCYMCGKKSASEKRFDTKEKFIEKARLVHGDKYIYDNVSYERSSKKVEIICREHGPFLQKPNYHLLGQGCPECKKITIGNFHRGTTEKFISKSKSIHGNTYDYSNTVYSNSKTPVEIICKKHGHFFQNPLDHIKGAGCPECGKEISSLTRRIKKEEFLERANIVHRNKYDYSNVIIPTDVINPRVEIICPKHGIFTQKLLYHLYGNGCQLCASEITESSGEIELFEFVKELLPNDKIERNVRGILNDRRELDIFIPSKNLAIEYDGLYWHSEKTGKDKKYHISKTEQCYNMGIRLIHIFEDEWENKKEICKSRIKSYLGISDNRCYARTCSVEKITSDICRNFLNENHMQGYVPSKYSYGLFRDNELISVMTLGTLRKNLGSSHKDNSYELLRFCNKLNWSIPGAASKLFKHFVDDIKPEEVISYADKRWSIGNLYEKIGFQHLRDSKPSYFYIINGKRYNRFNFRKDILVSKYGCDKTMTEHDFCLSKGWYRIYDCGCKVYKWG